MTNKLVIPEGYALTVTSWENDADNYMKETLYGLSLNEVKAYLKLCELFVSKNSRSECIGNIHEEYHDDEIEDAQAKLYRFYAVNLEFGSNGPELTGKEDLEDPEENQNFDYVIDHMETLAFTLGLMGRSEWYTRVFASFTVNYYKVDVYATDVTAEFK